MKTAAVLWCRNDNYKEDNRVITCLNSMIETFDEVWYIDWGSPVGTESLFWKIRNKITKQNKIKHIVVSPEITKLLCPDPNGVNACIPPNIVFKRTDADWIVNTMIDIIAPNKDVFDNFIKNANKNTFYTLARRDIEIKDLEDFGFEKWKEYRDYLDKTTKESRWYASVTPNDKYSLINCCGDFQLASKEVWNNIKGFEEQMVYACFNDTNVQKKAVLNGYNLEAIFDIPLYHMSHKGMDNDGSSPSKQRYNDAWDWVETFTESQNSEDWGLNGVEIEYEIW
jgi:hypothetical protein